MPWPSEGLKHKHWPISVGLDMAGADPLWKNVSCEENKTLTLKFTVSDNSMNIWVWNFFFFFFSWCNTVLLWSKRRMALLPKWGFTGQWDPRARLTAGSVIWGTISSGRQTACPPHVQWYASLTIKRLRNYCRVTEDCDRKKKASES